MRWLLLVLLPVMGAPRSEASAVFCHEELVRRLTELQRAANGLVLARPPATDEATLRQAFEAARVARAAEIAHGRGSLPPAIDLDQARAVLAEATRYAETDDFVAMRRLVNDPKTADRLGARLDRRRIVLDADFSLQARDSVRFVESFVDQYVQGEAPDAQNATYIPETDHARKQILAVAMARLGVEFPDIPEALNTIVLPEGVVVPGPNGSQTLPDDLPANDEMLTLLARQVCLADWEEIFHHVDWATWTATGESASQSMNALLRRLDLRYQWWAEAELAVAMYGSFDTRAQRGTDAVRQSFWRNYPELRHRVAQSPVVQRWFP